MSKRAIIFVLFAAILTSGCSISPGAKELKKSQARQEKQVAAEEDKPVEKAPDADSDTGKDKSPVKAAVKLTAAEIAAARAKFSSTCGGCHTLADAKTTGTVGPVLDGMSLTAEQVAEQIKNGGGAMPPGLLSGADAEAVAAYVAQVAGNAKP